MNQPKYQFGSKVVTTIKSMDKDSRFSFANTVIGRICSARTYSSCNGVEYEYGITDCMPTYGSYGNAPFIWIREKDIVLAGEE